MTYKISNTRSLGDLPIPNIWLWLNLCNLNPMSRLVTADNIWTAAEAAVTPFILSDPPVFLLAMQIQKFTKHTNICQCKGGKLNCKGRNKNFFWDSFLSFCSKVDKDFVTNTSATSANPWKWGQISANKKRDWERLRPGNRVRWGFRDWKCQLFTMPTNYSNPGRCYHRTVKVEDDELG